MRHAANHSLSSVTVLSQSSGHGCLQLKYQPLRVDSCTEEVFECHSCIDKPLQHLLHAVREFCVESKEHYVRNFVVVAEEHQNNCTYVCELSRLSFNLLCNNLAWQVVTKKTSKLYQNWGSGRLPETIQ